MNITLDDIFLILYVWIDDWHRIKYGNKNKVGRPAEMSDSELLTLMVGMDFLEFSSERHYVSFLQAHCKSLFPNLLDHSQYNRRTRALGEKLEVLRLELSKKLHVNDEKYYLIDTTPIIAVGLRRNKSHSDFLGSASFGYCAARRMHYFGYKLVLSCTLEGIPHQIELIPANTDEREAADQILDLLPEGSVALGDKGFIGKDWQKEWKKRGIDFITPARKNQYEQPDVARTKSLNGLRERVEGVFKVLKEKGRSIEHTLAHTVKGLCVRVLSKITSLIAKLFLQRNFGIDVLTFKQINLI